MNAEPPQGGGSGQPRASSTTLDKAGLLLSDELQLLCSRLLVAVRLFSMSFSLVQDSDDVGVVVYEVLRKSGSAIRILENGSDPTRAAPPHLLRVAFDVVQHMRQSLRNTSVLTPPTPADAAGAVDALSDQVFDDIIVSYLVMDLATATDSAPRGQLPKRQLTSMQQKALKKAEASLSDEDRKILEELRRTGLDIGPMARDLGISPVEVRFAFRRAANHLRDAYFNRARSATTTIRSQRVSPLFPTSTSEPVGKEWGRIFRENTLLHYIGAIERHDITLVGDVLRQAEGNPALERMILDISAKLPAYLFPSYDVSSALDIFAGRSHSLTVNPAGTQVTDTADPDDAETSFDETVGIELLIPLPMSGNTNAGQLQVVSLLRLAAIHLTLEQVAEAFQLLGDAFDIALEIYDRIALSACLYWYAAFEYVSLDAKQCHESPENWEIAWKLCQVGLKLIKQADEDGTLFDPSLRQRLEALREASRRKWNPHLRPN